MELYSIKMDIIRYYKNHPWISTPLKFIYKNVNLILS